ncbi:carbon-nitrogen hydrolase family protein [Erwinia persicina]|uniref:carbon-nitrogen hydrolase family protein n=1 Tax=Erwinia persicina TaxID=55211 RepID=UPI00177B19F1|nr:carbon-nitrogen hydrolase family protein [Erwinia persicina]MBD8215223.1 carbon-nitrogen hydrolase family protein [Erwinia persicina]
MKMSDERFRVAVVQASPVCMDVNASVDKALGLIADAARQGARLIAFPELFFPGYPWFLWLGNIPYMAPFITAYHRQSISTDSPQYQRLQQAARDNKIYLSFSFSEKYNAMLFISQALIDDAGNTLEVRRKLKPTSVERLLFGEGDGSHLKVHRTALGHIGQLCCGEHLQPLSCYALHAQNEQIHIAAWPSFSINGFHSLSGEVNAAVSQGYAAEGQCYLLFACAVVSEQEVKSYCVDDQMRQVLLTGGGYARIYGPDGRLLTQPLAEDQEGLLFSDVDLAAITLCKFLYDPAGHYSRPDATRLLLDPHCRQPVMVLSECQDIAETSEGHDPEAVTPEDR